MGATASKGDIRRIGSHVWGLFGYLVNPASVDKLVKAVFPTNVQLDTRLGEVNAGEMFDPSRPNELGGSKLELYAVEPALVKSPQSEQGDSDIQPASIQKSPPKK